MVRGLFGRWWRWCLSVRDWLARRFRRDEGFAARIERLSRVLDARLARATRAIEKLEAAVRRPPAPGRPGRAQRVWDRAERRVRSMVNDASRSTVRRPRHYNHAESVAEMERRLESVRACLTDIEAERDRAAEEAVSWHRRGLLGALARDVSLAREALVFRRAHEADYLRCAREARKLKAILDEMTAAAEVMASLGGERSSG